VNLESERNYVEEKEIGNPKRECLYKCEYLYKVIKKKAC
jgi:hypothetical protein